MKIEISIDKVKLEALKCYLPEETNVSELLQAVAESATSKELDKLYVRHVPKAVREFLTKKEESK
ncbi:MAG: hypothetical protein LUI06_05440 [Ruminococcus sp.]|nr:hypothetical protein [Ruminococcus sp.]